MQPWQKTESTRLLFLKDALIRKYGNDFYEALCATAEHRLAK